jgi:negative regulator of sigma E activity
LPKPVALVVTPIEPAGAVVVVLLAVTAVVKKYNPAPEDAVRMLPPSNLAASTLPSDT